MHTEFAIHREAKGKTLKKGESTTRRRIFLQCWKRVRAEGLEVVTSDSGGR